MKHFYKILIFLLWNSATAHDKWIVVTTINYPTPALKKLASLPDWRVVVVGDKKTPSDWHLENCKYLSPEIQENLGFALSKHLPWNHYARKNLGYLYAIKNGARIIYETDDDNLIDEDTLNPLPEYHACFQAKSSYGIVNPYAYFGQPRIWPRGYPLRKINTLEKNLFSAEVSPALQKFWMPIQQGLVNGDPDVDALFRLTHKHDIKFDNNNPICLAHGTMAPFNSQNTFFYHGAFWALLIPITVSFRTSDIWRSYWMQRLLWAINGHLSFFAPNVKQFRNEHDLLKDFIDEFQMYKQTEDLINFLISWRTQKGKLSEKMTKLMEKLVEHKFFEPQELELVKAWLTDLEQCGYTLPEISNPIQS